MNREAIAYILAEFPSQTETFILKEAMFVNESVSLHIIALKRGKNIIDNPVLALFKNRIVYIPQWWSWKFLLYAVLNLKGLLRKVPQGRYFHLRHLGAYLRRIKLLLIASFVSEKIKKLKIRHIHAHFANYPTDVAMMVFRLSNIPFSFTAHASG